MASTATKRVIEHPWIETEERLRKQSDHYAVDVPDGERGDYLIDRVEVHDWTGLANLRHIRDGMPELCVTDGTYVRLLHKGRGLIMSNTQMEYRTSIGFVTEARGHALISGLGLGMLLRPLLARHEVHQITVVEIAQEVIELVGPSYRDLIGAGRVRIVNADTFKWKPDAGTKFDCAFHDIWNDIGTKNLAEMTKLRRHYRSAMKPGAFQQCWAENLCRRMRKLDR